MTFVGIHPEIIHFRELTCQYPEMALRLSKALGRSAESWLVMQDYYDLWQAKQHIKLDEVQHIKFAAG